MLLRKFSASILLLVFQVWNANCYSGTVTLSDKNIKNRQKRQQLSFPFLPYFEYNSCYALAVVISTPLELPPGRSVFFSYNFETNYYYAFFDNANGLVPLPFTHIDEPGANLGTLHRTELPPAYRTFGEDAGEGKENQDTTETIIDQELNSNDPKHNVHKVLDVEQSKKESSKKKAEKSKKNRKVRAILNNYFMSRRRFFKMMESKMDSLGLKGHHCLLKAICETSQESFEPHNGVIGSVVDVLFLPSASKDEKLPKRYYQAEENGKLRNCTQYNASCPAGVLDFISTKI